MSDEGRPKQPTTVALPAVPPWAIELTKGMNEVRSDVRGIRLDVSLVSNDVGVVKERVAVLERRVDDSDKRASNASLRVRENSQQDLTQDAAIAQLVSQVGEIERKTDAQTVLLEKLVKLAANPIVKQIATAVGTAILTYLAAKGIK